MLSESRSKGVHGRALALAAVVVLVAGCVTTVSQIAEDPQSYRDRPVLIRGTIERGISVPLVDLSVYLFSDETGKALLVSKDKIEAGGTITIRGRVIAFPKDETKAAVAETTKRLAELLVSSGLADESKADRIAGAITGVAGTIAEGLGGLFLIVHES